MITKYIIRVSHKKDIQEKTNNFLCNQLKNFTNNLKIIMPDNQIILQLHQSGTNNISEEIQ